MAGGGAARRGCRGHDRAAGPGGIVTPGRRAALLGAAAAPFLLAAALTAFPELALGTWRLAARWRYGARAGEIEAGDARLRYLEVGRGRPVLLLHGLRGEGTVLLPLARELARRGFRAVTIDLPGHGRSPAPIRPLDIGAAANLLLEAAGRLEMGPRPALVGHSLGGWIVAYAALRDPGRCGPVVLVSSPGLPFDPPPLPQLLSTTVAQARASLPLLFARPPRFVPAPLLWIAVRRPAGTSAALLASALSGRFLLDGLLEGLAVPALVIFGEQDRLVPPRIGREMADRIGTRFEIVPGAGHMVVWERPAATAERIGAFLAAPPSAPE
ncbi:MAG: alpha/beta hydrolase [Acidobacteria bacterium]|nr:MAG: alpha/beta hydrolase [Acidobacteriota bacterium]